MKGNSTMTDGNCIELGCDQKADPRHRSLCTEHGVPVALLEEWIDPQARLAGVVAVGSRCACGNEAETVLNSPRWGAWDVCEPCGSDQLSVLHCGYVEQLDLVLAEAARCIQLDKILSC